jgi:hypothetical protein
LNPQAGQRQTACIRYISATPQRSHIILSTGGGVTLSGAGWAGFGVWESPMRAIIACAAIVGAFYEAVA